MIWMQKECSIFLVWVMLWNFDYCLRKMKKKLNDFLSCFSYCSKQLTLELVVLCQYFLEHNLRIFLLKVVVRQLVKAFFPFVFCSNIKIYLWISEVTSFGKCMGNGTTMTSLLRLKLLKFWMRSFSIISTLLMFIVWIIPNFWYVYLLYKLDNYYTKQTKFRFKHCRNVKYIFPNQKLSFLDAQRKFLLRWYQFWEWCYLKFHSKKKKVLWPKQFVNVYSLQTILSFIIGVMRLTLANKSRAFVHLLAHYVCSLVCM